ncbi:hypothetical protein JBF11_02235 [Taurinivorans muris]|uniref:Uncharacterized protein n=1 Tax=Taurinivorans muris TaxID=2787751 RepID=A0ABY5Y3S7_9BACT|nr:hypothetical protein JBF11_02235 [Desulfovibrionaceae bacterium LT0009]
MKEIKLNDIVFAKHITAEDWEAGLKFYSADDDFIQVGSWNYDKGKELLAHTHNTVERIVQRTQEVLYIRKGRIKADIYDFEDKKIAEFEAAEGDVVVLLWGGHGYSVLEDNTQVLEVKTGPYVGAELDRRRI